MQRLILILLCTGYCLAAQTADEAVKKELQLFQGKWTPVFMQGLDGKPASDDELKATSLVVEGNKFTLKSVNTIEGTFTIDPTKKVKTIDVFDKGSKDKPRVLGIYEIKGDTRRSCFADLGKDRPDGFRKEKGFLIFEWKRAK